MLYFNRHAGHEWIHLGLTSADIVENVQQIQIGRSASAIMDHAEQVLSRLLTWAESYADTPMAARTHGRPAQVTTVGKRFTDWGSELVMGMTSLHSAMGSYLPRGIKGAVGTRADLAQLLAQHPEDSGLEPIARAELLDLAALATADGEAMASVGQCYPRSLDLPIGSAALQLAAACGTICTNVRLWALLGHGNEVRAEEQVGSSAMPHKSNPRYSERVHSLNVVARGYLGMLQELAGAQWFEGDVTTSAARRVALPGLFHTIDSALANTAHVLDVLKLDDLAIAADLREHLDELASARLLAAAVHGGMSRSKAHRVLRSGNPGADPDFPLSAEQIKELVDVQQMARPAATIARDAVAGALGELPPLDLKWPGRLL
jgi:adenylosuccinate lyase